MVEKDAQIKELQDLAKKTTSITAERTILDKINWSVKYKNDEIRQITHAEHSGPEWPKSGD